MNDIYLVGDNTIKFELNDGLNVMIDIDTRLDTIKFRYYNNVDSLMERTYELKRSDYHGNTTSINLNRVKDLVNTYLNELKSPDFIYKYMGDWARSYNETLTRYCEPLITNEVVVRSIVSSKEIPLAKVKNDGIYIYSLINSPEIDDLIRKELRESYFGEFIEINDAPIERTYYGIVINGTLYIDNNPITGDREIKLGYHQIMKVNIDYYKNMLPKF